MPLLRAAITGTLHHLALWWNVIFVGGHNLLDGIQEDIWHARCDRMLKTWLLQAQHRKTVARDTPLGTGGMLIRVAPSAQRAAFCEA